MSTVVLIQASPRLVSTGAISDVRLAGGGSGPYFHLGFADWRAGVTAAPRFSTALGFDQSGWTGGALPQTGALRFFPSDKALMTAMAGYSWERAPITITTADDEAVPIVYKTAFVGTVAALNAAGGAVTATVADLSVDLDKPVLTDTFAGSGGIEGGDDAVGRIKRRTWGVVFNVEGRLLDKAYSIYEFSDPARPLQAFPMVKDKGREAEAYVDVAWQGSVAATLAALRNASAPTGGCARAPSIACVKWWTTPAGPLTADIEGEVGSGYVGAPIAIAARLATTFSTRITVDAASKAAAEGYAVGTARAGVHVDETTETVGNLLDRLLLPVSFAWVLGANGVMLFRRLAWVAPSTSLRAETIERETTFKPLRTRTLGYQRNYRQHSDAEISVVLTEGIPVVIQWAPSATGPWHDGDPTAEDLYYRQSTNGGATYGAAIKGVGRDGADALTLIAGSATTIVEGNTVRSTAEAAGVGGEWGIDAASSREAYTGGAVATFTFPATGSYGPAGQYEIMAGLTQGNPGSTNGNSFNSITFALYRNIAGVRAFINGAPQGAGVTPMTGDINGRVHFDGRYVRWFANELQIGPAFDWMGTSGDPNAAANALRFRTTLHSVNGPSIRNITLAAAGAAGKNGEPGLPGIRGNDGTTYYPYYAYANSPDGQVDFTTGAPEGRAYVGFSNGTSATEPESPIYYAWSQYKGPSFGLTSDGGVAVAGNQLIKLTSAPSTWAAQAYSTEGYRNGATAAARPTTQGAIFFGLNADPNANASYEGIDCAWYFQNDGHASIWTSGANRSSAGEAPYAFNYGTSLFQVAYDGKTVQWLRDGVVIWAMPAAPNQLFYWDSSFNTPNGRLIDVGFSAAGTSGEDGKSISITPASSQLRVGKDGNYIGGQAFTFNVTRVNLPGTTVFTRSDGYANTAAGYVATDPAGYSSSGPDNLTVAASNAAAMMDAIGGAAGRFAFTASVPGFPQSATAEVKKIVDGKDGENGANGASNSSATSFGGTPGTLVPPGATVTLETSVQVVNNGTSGQFRVELYRQMQGGGSVVVNAATQTIAAGGDFTFNVSGTYTNTTGANVFLQGAAFAFRVSNGENVGGQGYVRIY